jgi:RimJ/RimL family protein N-acetyltransferase
MRMTVHTSRLLLVAGTTELVTAELHHRKDFADRLKAQIPTNWPPPLNDDQTMKWCLRYFIANEGSEGWVNWYFVLKSHEDGGSPVAIGNGGFRGKATTDGTVELGYSILPQFQNVGYASEAAGGLIEWAFSHPEVKRVIAETYPTLQKSIRVLEKNGFRFLGSGGDPQSVRYERLPHCSGGL